MTPAAHESKSSSAAHATSKGDPVKAEGLAGKLAENAIDALIASFADEIAALKQKIVDTIERLTQARHEAAPSDVHVAAAMRIKEQEGEVATQGQLDRLSLAKSRLEQIESFVKAP